MTTFEKAAAVYDHPMCNRVLREDLEAHLLHGMVYANDRCFIMGRYVRRDMHPDHIINPWITEPTGLADCIHIYLAAGDISECFTFPHDPVKWVSFERRNKLRFYSYQQLLENYERRRPTTTTPNPAPSSAQ